MKPTPLYLIDDENVSFTPHTVHEAIILFNRMKRKNQVHWDYVPELLQKLAAELGPEDHDRFCEWVCNPTSIKPGRPGYFASLCQDDNVDSVEEEKLDAPDQLPDIPESFDPLLEDHTTLCDNSICSESVCISDEQCIQPTLPKL